MSSPTTYEIVLRGHPGPRLLRPLLDDFDVDTSATDVTRLTGDICDPSHLHGVLAHLTSVNVEVVSLGPCVTLEPERWDGRLFGALMLAAFPLYGVGSTVLDRPVGLALVGINSLVVTALGLIGYRRSRPDHLTVGATYLGARAVEALLLGYGGLLAWRDGDATASITIYLLAMLALSLGSLPFWRIAGERGWISNGFSRWGIAGYLTLAAGAAIELTTGTGVTTVFAIPGGLFEFVAGITLLRHGFGPLSNHVRMKGIRR